MKIYAVYECDAHMSYNSIVFKKLDTCKERTKDFFDDHKESYINDNDGSGYLLVFAKYDDSDERIDGDALNNFSLIETTFNQ